MRRRRFVVAGLITIGFTFLLELPGLQTAYANPVFADDRSLSNGAELYALYCSDCHGSVISNRATAPVATNNSDQAID